MGNHRLFQKYCFLKYFCKILHNSIYMLRRLRTYAPLMYILRTYYAPNLLRACYAPITHLLQRLRRYYAGVTQVTHVLQRCYAGVTEVTQVLRRCYGGYVGVTEFYFLLRRCLRRSVTTRNFDV